MVEKCPACDGCGSIVAPDRGGYEPCEDCSESGWTDRRFRCQRCGAVIRGGINAYGDDDNTCRDCAPAIEAEWAAMKQAARR